MKDSGSYKDRLRELHKEVWTNVDLEDFLKKERQSWDKYVENLES